MADVAEVAGGAHVGWAERRELWTYGFSRNRFPDLQRLENMLTPQTCGDNHLVQQDDQQNL